MKKSHILLLLLAFSTKLFALGQQVIYVDIANNTGIENGTQSHPFNTILEGLNVSQDNDSIAIASGTYTEDTLLIERCVSIAGDNQISTIVNGVFVLSSKLDTLPVLIRNLWCENINHNDSGYTLTPLIIEDCSLQVLNDYTPAVGETGRILLKNCFVDDSIHIESATCAAKREIIDCESNGGLWVSCSSSQGNIRIMNNQVAGSMRVKTISKSDTVFITGNNIADSLVLLSVASDPDMILNNFIGNGMRFHAVAHSGFQFSDNQVQNSSLSATFTALSESEMKNNTFLNGGIYFKAVAGDIAIKENEIHTDGSVAGINLKTTAGGYFENNTITLPYFEPSGLPFEEDTASVCGINVKSTSFGGMKGNRINGGAYGVYLSAISSNDFDLNEIEDSHHGLYLQTVSGQVDSNMIENCAADGMILNYQAEYDDTNSIRLNYNIIRNNGGHGVWTKGNAVMGNLKDPGTGFNVISNNGGYDLYVETPSTFVDTIWAQNNEWTHSTEEEVGELDIFDVADEPGKALVMFKPLAPSGIDEFPEENYLLWPNPTRGKFQVTSTKHQTNSKFKIQNSRIELVDLYGKLVMDSPLHRMGEGPGVGAGTLELDISHLPAGIYFIRISVENLTIVKKVIKL